MAFINRWVLTAWAKPWVPFRLSREHDGSSGSQVPSHRRFNVGVIVVHGATAAIKGHGNKLIKMSLADTEPTRGSRGVFPIRDPLTFHGQPDHPYGLAPPSTCTCKPAPDSTCFSEINWLLVRVIQKTNYS